jgi:hypothetical protein
MLLRCDRPARIKNLPGRRAPLAAGVIALGLAGGVCELAAQPATVTVANNLQWESRPTLQDIADVFPNAARALNPAEGRVQLSCSARRDGGLESCRVDSEQPAGVGFGEAAMRLVPKFRMKALTRDGQSVEGAQVILPVLISLPGPPPLGSDPRSLASPSRVPTVRMRCRVDASGAMRDCVVTPEGQ